MLRTIFVIVCLMIGLGLSFRGPFYALQFYLWYAYFRPDGWLHDNWVLQLRVSLVAGILTLLMLALKPAEATFRVGVGLVLIVLGMLHTLASTMNSLAPEWSWFWWSEFVKVCLIGIVIAWVVNSTAKMRLTLMVIAYSLAFEAVKQGWAQLILNPGGRNVNVHLVLGDNNGVALGMFMLAPIVGSLLATSSGWERWIHRFTLGGVVLRGIGTYSRGGFLAAIVVGLHSALAARHRLRVLAGAGVLAGVIVMAMPPEFWERMDSIDASEEERDTSAASRLYFWEVALRMSRDYPLLGVGFNAYSRVFDAYDETGGLYGTGRAVHSSWFGMLAEGGIPGLAVLVSLLLYSFVVLGRVAKRTQDPELKTYARALRGSLLAFIVGGSFLNGQYSELLWHIFALSIAAAGIQADELKQLTASDVYGQQQATSLS